VSAPEVQESNHPGGESCVPSVDYQDSRASNTHSSGPCAHAQFMLSRRTLLTVAGSVSLAGSGLLLPAGLTEVDARHGALGGARGGRRGKNRRGRDRRKSHGHGKKKHKNRGDEKPRGRGFLEPRGIAFHIHNYRSVPVEVQGWEFWIVDLTTNYHDYLYQIPDGWGWSTIPARAADGSHSAKSFKSTERHVAVQIGTDRVVFGANAALGWPQAAIRSGAWNLNGRDGGETLAVHDLLVWQSINADGIKITRVPDDDDYIQFSVDL
jgi:hypothetical protein